MKRIWAFVLLAIAIAFATPSLALSIFHDVAAAQQHCPTDQVVWLNLPTRIYHLKGQRWYANTKTGAFVCRREADADGSRETRNGE